ILQEWREATGGDGTMMKLRNQFYRDIGDVLNEEQMHQFRRLASQAMRPDGGGPLQGALMDIQVLRRALRDLELPRKQKRAALKHFEGLKEGLPKVRQEGEEALAEYSAELRKAVLAELDEEQVAALEAAEAELRERMAEHRQRRRPGQAGEPTEPAPPPVKSDDAEEDEPETEEAGDAGGD
ncbi:MAG TPA: hypothetical protein VM243_02500, partial [Phycisphaerae bacterium]|nr:hypothetical protein [Phycisphaerae bacterium]